MTALLTAVVFKGSMLMIVAVAAVAVMARASAATRHFVWALAIVGLLALPIVTAALPSWEIAVPIATSDEVPALINDAHRVSRVPSPRVDLTDNAVMTPVETSPRATAVSVPWALLAVVGYLVGVLALLGRLVAQHQRARAIVRETTRVTDPEWTSLLDDCAARIGLPRPVSLLRSRTQLMPMTIGTISPVVVVPADADGWDEERRRAVLLHELAHIARRDCLTQLLSAIATAVYWVHPGVWYVARRLRVEREVACDDRVLAAGAQASDYAGHLLELAYGWSGRRAPALVVGMAGSRKLEGRMRAVLDPARNRTTLTRRTWLAGAAVSAAVLVPIAIFTVTTTTASQRNLVAVHQPSIEAVSQQPDVRSTDSQEQTSGTWEVRRADSPWRVHLRVRLGGASFNGEIDSSEFERLTGQPLSSANGPVRFNIEREAGTFEIAGTIRAGAGTGTFQFVPSESFIMSLTGRGFLRPSVAELMALAQRNIGLAFVDELAAQKYVQPPTVELVRAADHGVDLDYLREMGRAGYRVGTLDALIRFRDHGVSPEFIRELKEKGLADLSPDDLVRARDHGVDAEFIGGLADLGYSRLEFDRIVRARDHGVDPEYAREMRKLGYTPTLDELIRARDHGVDPEYVAMLRDAGYSSLPLDEVIRTRDHGVDPEYIREMRAAGYKLSLGEMIKTRDHGVTPDYVEMMAALGYKNLPIETVVRLRDHGVTPDFVLELQRRGFKNLSVEEIIRLRDRAASNRTVMNYLNDGIARLWQKLTDKIDVEEFLDKALKKT